MSSLSKQSLFSRNVSSKLIYVSSAIRRFALIVIALIIGGVQDLHLYNIYGDASNKGYFYGALGVILIVGIIMVAYSALKRKRKLA